MKYLVIAVLIFLFGATVAFFNRQEIMGIFTRNTEPEIVEVRDFQCEGMSGFAFAYPHRLGEWESTLPVKIDVMSCNLLYVLENRIVNFKISKLPEALLQIGELNKNGVPFEIFVDGEPGTKSYIFFDVEKDYAFEIQANIAETINFPESEFWKQVIESFKVVDSNARNISSRLENALLDTAWIQLDQDGNETDFEINFRKTKNNDPSHNFYDYQDYLHQRPGVSGYWRVDESTVTVTPYPSNVPPVIYTNVIIAGDILNVTDSLDGAKVKLKKMR